MRARIDAPAQDLAGEASDRFGARLVDGAEGRLVFHCAKPAVPDLSDWLIGCGAEHVGGIALDSLLAARNPLFDLLLAGLDQPERSEV